MLRLRKPIMLLLSASLAATCPAAKARPQSTADQKEGARPQAPAEDISGMYTFLKEGEFLQINCREDEVTGYISRKGDREGDRGTLLSQSFSEASVQGHDVAFTTEVVHGVSFEFKGRFERGRGKTKAQDSYYVLRGTLTEFTPGVSKTSGSRSREVKFKWMAQP